MLKFAELRKRSLMTQAQVASMLGKTTTAYANYEKGQREMNYDGLIALSKFYGVTINYMLGVDNAKSEAPSLKVPSAETPIQLTQKEKELLSVFKKLEPQLQERLIGIAIGYTALIEEVPPTEEKCFG